MQASDLPPKFPIPFANGAGGPYIRPIPQASQIGVNPGYASLTDGFVPLNFTPIGSGGIPPFGQDMNGLLKQITQWSRWQAAGGPNPYDAAFQTGIGGYPLGAVIAAAAGGYWVSLVDNNVTNPDTGGAGWDKLGIAATGSWQWRPTGETLPGWVKANATTIGSASSGASQVADASAAALYAWFWTNFSNTQCPVSGGRGGSAAADFAANKTLQVLDMRGAGVMGMDTMGGAASTFLTGVPVTTGAATTAGSLLGENLHALTSGENAAHTHGITDTGHTHAISPINLQNANNAGASPFYNQTAGTVNTQSATTGITVNSSGSGTAHNTVQKSYVGTHYFKL